jgi:REP element-mobilizing transposase RayT
MIWVQCIMDASPFNLRKNELRSFCRAAEPLLDFPVLWFDEAQRMAIGEGMGEVIRRNGYTVWSYAICRNHSHLVVRRHRHQSIEIRDALANGARDTLIARHLVDPSHPVWSSRPHSVYLNTPSEVVSRVDYVQKNPEKEGLPPQHWDFVKAYDGWPGKKWGVRDSL